MISSTGREDIQGGYSGVSSTASRPMTAAEAEAPMPADRWPLWKTLTFIIVYCTAAWSVIGLALWALFR